MNYILYLLIIATSHNTIIEVKNKKHLTSIQFNCFDNGYNELICRTEATHYVVADGSCLREVVKDNKRFSKTEKNNTWHNVYMDVGGPDCALTRYEVLKFSKDGWSFTVENILLGTNPGKCDLLKNKIIYSEKDNFTNVLCE